MPRKILNKNLIYLFVFLLVASCSSVPKYPQNACKIFGENYLWYKSAKKSSQKYGAPIYIILAFVNKESGFKMKSPIKCWKGYRRKPGTTRFSKGSCVKIGKKKK